MADPEIAVTVIVTVLGLLGLLGSVILFLILNHNRRIKHRAVVAELKLTRDREVMQAEREAQQQTLQEVGRELHDNLGQLLTVAQMGLDTVLDEHPQDHRVKEVMNTLEQSIEEVRRLGRSLNVDLWQERSLADAITAEAVRIERAGIAQVLLSLQGELPPMTADVKTILFRTFQEIMNNALKHARSEVIDVSLQGSPRFALVIADHGNGFAQGTVERGNGLINIRRRCELIGYTAELSSTPGQGSTWHISAP
jgi:hypothetical protein